jgi:ribosomal protein S26
MGRRKGFAQKISRKPRQYVLSDECVELIRKYSAITGLNHSEIIEQAINQAQVFNAIVTEYKAIKVEKESE